MLEQFTKGDRRIDRESGRAAGKEDLGPAH